MRLVWVEGVGDESDRWESYWSCSRDDRHVLDFPSHFGYDQ